MDDNDENPETQPEKFFWFPLALLAYPQSPNAIVEWCFCEVAEWKRKNMKRAAKALSVKCNSNNFDRVLADAKAAKAFLNTCSDASRANKVRVKSKFFWACKNGKLSIRHFRVLCALLSKIGKKRYAKCGWREIQARAAGRCGKTDMEANPPPTELLLTRQQIRWTIQQLEAWGFFARFPFSRQGGSSAGEVWFSFSMSPATLVKMVCEKKDRAKLTAKLSAIRAEQAAIVTKIYSERKRAENPPTVTNPATTKATTINTNDCNENVYNENVSKDKRKKIKKESFSNEEGLLIDGTFMPIKQAEKLYIDNPNQAGAILANAVRAVRNPDGSVATVLSNQSTIRP
jgi:hypothetical protein